MLQIKIKYLTDVEKIKKIPIGDWIDLRTAEEVTMEQGESKLIPLGIAMQLPDGYEAHVIPRSSTFLKFKILQTNSFGLIDQSYCGNNDQWFFPAVATEDVVIPKNTRICQFRIAKKMEAIELVEVEDLGNDDRGGLGSTGTN